MIFFFFLFVFVGSQVISKLRKTDLNQIKINDLQKQRESCSNPIAAKTCRSRGKILCREG